MYPLMNLAAPVNKKTIDKIGKPFAKTSPIYPLTNLDTPLDKEIIDKIHNRFY